RQAGTGRYRYSGGPQPARAGAHDGGDSAGTHGQRRRNCQRGAVAGLACGGVCHGRIAGRAWRLLASRHTNKATETTMTQSVLIIGAGQAGAWVARTLRNEGYGGRIVLCGDEQDPPYERPPLSKEQLQAEPPCMPYLITHEEFAALQVEWIRGDAAVRIDRDARTVALASGATLAYGALVLATGGRAYLPPVPGFELDCVHTLRTLPDARRLRGRFQTGARVLVVGGGWIGLEVAAAARDAGCEVTLVEMSQRLCARSAPASLSSYLAGLHASRGVSVRLGVSVTALRPGERGGCT